LRLALWILLALVFTLGAIFFLARGSDLVLASDYVGGLVHLLIGLGLVRGALELARLVALPPRPGGG
jgi:hypothetical protein